MNEYIVERVDVSWVSVWAHSPEEAIETANRNPDEWIFEPGTPTANGVEE